MAGGWRSRHINAEEIAALGRELYKRLSVMGGTWPAWARRWAARWPATTQFVGSLETQVLTQARRFEDLKVDHRVAEIKELRGVDAAVRPLLKLAAEGAPTAPALTLVEAAPTSPAAMTLRRILTVDGDMAALKKVSAPVARVDDALRALMDDMLETMYDAPGIGLAAIQVGEPKRVIVMDLAKGEEPPAPRYFVNPEILWASEETAPYEEGCLSVPEIFDEVERSGPGAAALSRL